MEYSSGIRRFEIYGDMTWEKVWNVGCELSDYDHMHERYKFGDIVKFKYPIYGYSKGIITSVAEPESGADIYISRLYDVFCGEIQSYHVMTLMEFHHETSKQLIGTDKEAARRAVKELFPWMYIEEYRKEVDLL